jgi:hypothetical protein
MFVLNVSDAVVKTNRRTCHPHPRGRPGRLELFSNDTQGVAAIEHLPGAEFADDGQLGLSPLHLGGNRTAIKEREYIRRIVFSLVVPRPCGLKATRVEHQGLTGL